jgi:hypothetical protein
MEQTEQKTDYNKSTALTDLNMQVANLMIIHKGNRKLVANELGISETALIHHLKRIRNSTELSHNEINDQRSRLKRRLKATDRVIAEVLKPGKVVKDSDGNKTETPGYKTDFQRLKLAAGMAVDINKGLGVLSEHREVSGEIDLIAQKREDRQTYIAGLRTFGKELPADYEIIDNGKDSQHIEAHTSTPRNDKDKASMDLSDNETDIDTIPDDKTDTSQPNETQEDS